MMGQHEHGQGRLFYHFDLEEMVPADHLLRGIAHFLDLSGLRRFRLRGMTGASDERLLAATALNLRKLAKTIWRPPMTGELCPA